MKNYINADLYRIFSRRPRWIMIILVLAVMAVIFWPGNDSRATIIELVDLLETILRYVPIYIGFIEIIYIFGDDFAGKTAQIAIGTGVKRREVIMAKWLETIIVTAVDVCMIVVVAMSLSLIKTRSFPLELIPNIFAHMFIGVLATGAFMALVFPIMFWMQNITIAFLIYILLAAGAINKILKLLATSKILRALNIEKLTLSNSLNVFRSRMILGTFKIDSIIIIGIYIVGALFITCMIYKKRELEF